MKQFLYLVILCFVGLDAYAQTEPRLVLPIGHTHVVTSAVFSPDGRLALTTSADGTARIYDVSTGKELLVLKTNSARDKISAVFGPNGRLVLTAGDDGTARIYEVSSGKELQVLKGQTTFWKSYVLSPDGQLVLMEHDDTTARIYEGCVRSAVFSPDGQLVLTARDDGTARIYESATGKELHVLKGEDGDGIITSAVFSPDGRLALAASICQIARIYEVSSGKELQVLGPADYINSAVFSPNSKLVMLTPSYDSIVHIYEVSTGQELKVLTGHNSSINSAVFSSDGRLALTSSHDKTARIYDVTTGKELQVLTGHVSGVNSAVFSPDGKLAITAGEDKTARIYDVSTGKELQVLTGHYGEVYSAVFSPNGQLALTASQDASARIFEVSTGKELHTMLGYSLGINSAVFSPDGKLALTPMFGEAVIFEVATGQVLQVLMGHTGDLKSAFFSPDGRLALTASDDKTARIYDVSTGKELQVLTGHIWAISSAVFSPDGRLVLTAGDDATARIFDVSSGKELRLLIGHTSRITSVVFSPDGRLVLTAGADGTARIYEVATGKELHVLKENPLNWFSSAVFSPDGRLVLIASGGGGTARIFEVSSGKELHVLTGEEGRSITSAVFSPDGKLIVSASSGVTARIYDASTGQELQVLTGHTDELKSVVFSPDGTVVLTSSKDGTARIYVVSTGKELRVLKGHSQSLSSAVFSSDGKYILTTGADNKTILWDANSGNSLYTRLQLVGGDWLVYDEHYRFDGSPWAIEQLYFVCGLEVIDLAQMKDSLWLPGLAERIMTNQPILINDKPAPKLSELNICELTPVIEPIEQEDKRMLKYRITQRRGALGDTELYINGNLTYTYKPEKLEKKKEGSTTAYYLTIDSDTLQGYLAGKQYADNPLLIKSKVKGTGIYGRGEQCTIAKKSGKDDPHFYGVFIGVNDYGNERKEPNEQYYKNLDFAVKDAQDLSVAVEQTARNLFKDNCHIYRLTGEGNTPPTKDNLKKVLADIGSKSKASDVLYIFFAGHGDVRRMKDTLDQVVVEQDQIRFMMQRADKRNPVTTSFGVRELSEWCSPRRIKAQKRVFVFDACHSGKITQEAAGGFRGDDEGTRIRQLDKLKDKNGMMILAAAAADESAYEDETLNQGVLTYHLLQVMKEEAKDTSLVVRDWFDRTIDFVQEYSRLNGNKQEPSSFGDGRFEIGNVHDNVRDSIKITCPKTRVGACVFVDPTGEAEALYPQLDSKINAYFNTSGSRGNLVYSKKTDKAYWAKGAYDLEEGKIKIRFTIKLGDQTIGQPISLPARQYASEDELVQVVVDSIAHEIESLRDKDNQCKLRNK